MWLSIISLSILDILLHFPDPQGHCNREFGVHCRANLVDVRQKHLRDISTWHLNMHFLAAGVVVAVCMLAVMRVFL